MPSAYQLTAHHIGCLTDNIENTIAEYSKMGFTNISEVYFIKEQGVKACFIKTGNDFFLELVEFDSENKSLMKIFKTKNPYYHLGYLVDNINAATAHFCDLGYHQITRFKSEAFPGKTCVFFYSNEMHLIELIGN